MATVETGSPEGSGTQGAEGFFELLGVEYPEFSVPGAQSQAQEVSALADVVDGIQSQVTEALQSVRRWLDSQVTEPLAQTLESLQSALSTVSAGMRGMGDYALDSADQAVAMRVQ